MASKKVEVIKGKTSTGFAYSVKKKMLTNAEFLELFAKVNDGDQMKVFDLIEVSLGKEQKAKLYDHVRDEDGIVPLEALSDELTEIFDEIGKDEDAKN